MTTLVDQVVLVTGANRGLGRAFVDQLLDRGVAKVYAAARHPDSMTVRDRRVVPLQMDVTDPESVSRAARRADDVSIVINNAGICVPTAVLSADSANLRRELDVNLFGSLAVTSAFADALVRRQGAVVNIGSVLAWIGLGASYSVSKAALRSATDSMRLDLEPRGVQVVGVYMGYVDTDMAAGVTAPKTAPAEVARQVLDGIETGAAEVLADQTARDVRAALNRPVADRYASLTASPASRPVRLAGSSVLVTGANRGIGAELVRQLLDRGAERVYAAARDPLRLSVTDARVVPLALDVTDPTTIQRACESAADVDVLINNAGIASSTSVLEPDITTLRRELETNLFGPLAVTGAFAGKLPDKTSAVVTIASVASWIGLAGTYGVSKAAVWSAVEAMRLELAPRGIHVVSVHMAQVDTDLTAGSNADKSDPKVIVRQILDGLEAGNSEVLADDLTRAVRDGLPEPIEAQFARFASYAA